MAAADAADAEEHLIDLIDAAIARVAEHARNDRDCALLIAELEAVKHRVQSNRIQAKRAVPS